jgi:hypothetical protein
MAPEKWHKLFRYTLGQWRMDLQADDAGMTVKGQDGPVAEMLIESDECAPFSNGSRHDLRIVGSRLPNVLGAQNIMASTLKNRRQLPAEHLVQIESHRSPRNRFGEFGVLNGG